MVEKILIYMLTIADKVFAGSFSLWVYGTDSYRTNVWNFLQAVEERIEKRFEVLIRMIDSNPMGYSHEDNFKLLEDKVWELKFVSHAVRLAAIWV